MPMPRGNKFVLNGGKIRSLQRLLRLVEDHKDFGWKKAIGFSTYRQSHRILERLARLLWKAHDPLGAIHLADFLRLWGMSTEDKSLNTFTYAAALYSEWLPRFVSKKHKSAEDHFLLGMHYMRGSKITPSPTAARLCFRRAMTAGLPNAHHELAWSMAMDSPERRDGYSTASRRPQESLTMRSLQQQRDEVHQCEDRGLVESPD